MVDGGAIETIIAQVSDRYGGNSHHVNKIM